MPTAAAAQHGSECTALCEQQARHTDASTRTGPLAIACPWCEADPGRMCRTRSRDHTLLSRSAYHPARVAAAPPA